MQRPVFTGGKFFSPGQTQWAPALTSHDPNPPIPLEGFSPISGTSSATLAGTTGTATGVAEWTGTSSATLANVTGTATGTAPSIGASSATLANVTGTATGLVAWNGTSSATLGGITGTATGIVSWIGTSTATLANVTGTATGVVNVVGTSSVTAVGVNGSATDSTLPDIMTVTWAQLLVPIVQPILGGFSSQQLQGLIFNVPKNYGLGSAPALGASSGTQSVTGTATGTVASIEQMRVTRAMFTAPLAVGGAATGTSSRTLAGATGTATSGTAGERMRVTWVQFATPPGISNVFVDMPVTLSPVTTISLAIDATLTIEAGRLGTAAGTLDDITGTATGVISSGDSSSIANLEGVGGNANGAVGITGTASDGYVGVRGSATAVTIPLIPGFGDSAQTLAGVTGEASAITAITGISVAVLGGVFADMTGTSAVTLAGVSGRARGGLRSRPDRRMRAPGTRSHEQIRPIGRPSTLFSISAVTYQGAIGHAQGFIQDIAAASSVALGTIGSATGTVLSVAGSDQSAGDVTGTATGVAPIAATSSGTLGVDGTATGAIT